MRKLKAEMLKADEKTTDHRTTGQQDQPSGIGGPMSEPMQINLAENAVLLECEWNFEKVPDDELVACCYWEYARESAFILDVKRRCIDSQCQRMMNSEVWSYWGKDLERIQSIGYPAGVFLRGFTIGPGFDCRSQNADAANCRSSDAPPAGGLFPRPWQSLCKEERKGRSRIGSDRTMIPLVPFGRGPSFFAGWIGEHCDRQRATAFAKQASVASQRKSSRRRTSIMPRSIISSTSPRTRTDIVASEGLALLARSE